MLEEKILDRLADQIWYNTSQNIEVNPENLLSNLNINPKTEESKIYRIFIGSYQRLDTPETNFLIELYENEDINRFRIFKNSLYGGVLGMVTQSPLTAALAGITSGLLTQYDEKKNKVMDLKKIFINSATTAGFGYIIDRLFNFPGYFTKTFLSIGFLFSTYTSRDYLKYSITKYEPDITPDETFQRDVDRIRDIKEKNLYRFTLDSLIDIKENNTK